MKSDDLGKAIEAERTALHALLFEHRQGLALADIAVELGLTEERAEELLRTQEVRQLVRSEVDEDEGVLRYVTLRVSPPSSDAKSALASLIAVRSAVLHARRRARAAAVSVVATVLFAAGGWFALRHLADASGGSTTVAHPLLVEVARAPLARADEQASVSNASAQRRAWIEEANDLDARVERLEGEARASVCITRWTLGEPCYDESSTLDPCVL